MRRSWIVLSVILIGRTARAESAEEVDTGTRMLAPIQYEQLTVLPLVATGKVDDTAKYLTLKEGLKQKAISIREMAGGGDVNHVRVENKSDRPLLLLAGEVILGGQQDRIIGQTTILKPKERSTVGVYCVEHGRWAGQGGFDASGGLVERKARVAAAFKGDQADVWKEVASKTQALSGASATGTYRTLATGAAGEKVKKQYREHLEKALGALPDRSRLVGLAAAVNGRIISFERFASPELFARYRDDLLNSMIVSAADSPRAAAAPIPSAADVKGFVEKGRNAPAKAPRTKEGMIGVDNISHEVAQTIVEERPNAEPLHKSIQAIE